MEKTIGLQTLRQELSRVIGRIYHAQESYIVELYGKPAAVVLNIAEYQRLRMLERLGGQRILPLEEAQAIVRGDSELPPWPPSAGEAVARMLQRRDQAGRSPVTAAEWIAEGRAEREVIDER